MPRPRKIWALSALLLARVAFAAPRFTPPRPLDRLVAAYPEEAHGLAGTVLVRIVVGVDGAVARALVVQRAGHGFDEAAVEAARRLRFEPATQEGAPVPAQIDVRVDFQAPPQTALPPEALRALQATVGGERPPAAASARTVRDSDFLLRPRVAPDDILRAVPGLLLAQHQGGGKADQLFLRGFDADHGTDVSLSLDGVPVNLPSHAHGQGYADLHFLIPEAIERVEISKGPYFAELGDFDTAGAVNLVTRDRFERSQVTAMSAVFPTLSGARDDGTPRRFGGYRLLGIATPDAGEVRPWIAGEVYGTGGPFLASEQLRRYNLFAKSRLQLSERTTLSLFATAYASSWFGSGQIPARLVKAGVLDRYGSIDPTEGGETQRQQAVAALDMRPDARSRLTVSLSLLRSSLTLFNDFTFQAVDAQSGDEIEQDDRRTSLFASVRYERRDRPAQMLLATTLGAQLRTDGIAASLWKVRRRERLASCLAALNPCVETYDRQTNAAAFAQEDLRPVRWLRVELGLRADVFAFDVHPGSEVQRGIVSPKASLVVTPLEPLDLYLNFGSGFHSNDARSVIAGGGAGALPRALGYELGLRARTLDDKLELSAALWRLDLQSELVWNGDEGTTESGRATTRLGVDLSGRWQILSWLDADLDVSLAKSRYKINSGNGDAVALAPSRIVTGGLTARHPSGVQASLRVRHIGPRPASQLTGADGVPACSPALDAGARCYLVADGYTVLDATLAYVARRFSVSLMAENLTDAVYREAQFGNLSQVIARPPGAVAGFSPETHPLQDLHFTPGNPLGLQLAVSTSF